MVNLLHNRRASEVLPALSQALTTTRLEREMAGSVHTFYSDKVKARFWGKVARAGYEECWVWLGRKNHSGYGLMTIERKGVRAHRISFVLNGSVIPEGYVIDHICRNRACVNPAHLRAVTKTVNTIENSYAVSAFNKVKNHCPQGHPYSEENTRIQLRKSGIVSRICKACSRFYSLRYYHETAALKGADHAG